MFNTVLLYFILCKNVCLSFLVDKRLLFLDTEFLSLQTEVKAAQMHFFFDIEFFHELQVGILLRALGYGPHTRIYVSGEAIFGGQRVLIPLRAMFSNLEDRTTLTTEEERASIYGPEEPLPPPLEPPPPPSLEDVQKKLKAWKNAGPRPRPLPPPPSRNVYTHELEGWWGWLAVSEEEPFPSLEDLRLQGHKLLWAALDYIVCVESTAFFPGFDRDKYGRPNFASLVMGHRAYMLPSLRTYRPDRFLFNHTFRLEIYEDFLNRTYT
jgi:hypothetical protein